MPLLKKAPTATESNSAIGTMAKAAETGTPEQLTQVAAAKKAVTKRIATTKDEYWTNREERDIQRDKDMAWSGLAQAALDSVGLLQLNTTNTLEGFVELVVKTTDLLLKARDKHNS